jgi:rRNA-processing protein FCF1
MKSPRTKLLLDSSFLLTMLKQHRSIAEELRMLVKGPIDLCVLDRVMFELGRLARTGSSTVTSISNAALQLTEGGHYNVLETSDGPSDVDASQITYALTTRDPCIVATLDRSLTASLRSQGISTISLRRVSGLELSRANVASSA